MGYTRPKPPLRQESDKICRSSLLTGGWSLTAGMMISSIASFNSANVLLAELLAVNCTTRCLSLLFLTYKPVTLSFKRLLHSIYHLWSCIGRMHALPVFSHVHASYSSFLARTHAGQSTSKGGASIYGACACLTLPRFFSH